MQMHKPILYCLRHAGVRVARPGILLVALAWLLASTLAYAGIALGDDFLLRYAEQHLPDLTPAGRNLLA